MTTIVYAHPYSESFNHAILEETKSALAAKGTEYTVMDLYADGFNPALEADSLKLYNEGGTEDKLAMRYLDTLVASDEIIFIFPIWWSTMPAIVHGFFDKVMLWGKAFAYGPTGLIPDKIQMKRTLIFSTSQAPTENFAPFFRDYFKPMVLDTVGMHNCEWHNCEQTAHGPEENRTAFLQLVRHTV